MEDNTFVVQGPKPFLPIPEETVGKVAFDRLIIRNFHEIALVDAISKETLTFRSLLDQACNLAEALRKFGCNNDTVISISSENNLEFFVPVFASFFAGTILAPLNPLYQENELEHCLGITKPKIIFVSHIVAPRFLKVFPKLNFVEKIIIFNSSESNQGAQTKKFNKNHATQLALVMCSSGTTGLPKGVMISHESILARTVTTWDPRYKDNFLTVLGLLPFYHAYGLNIAINSIINGHMMVVLKGFDEDVFLKAIQDYKIATLSLAPPLVVFLAKTAKLEKYDLSCVKEIYCGAAPLSEKIENTVRKRLNLQNFYQGYGLTEVNLAVTMMQKNHSKPGSVGKVVTFMNVKIRDRETAKSLGPNQVGEICVKGPQVMKGYYNNEQATREAFTCNGWLRTGDMGYYDKEEFFYIVDRLKDLIKYKGYQVAPAELEAILLTHPKVIDAGVVGLPDESAGELPVAFVVKKIEDVTEKELQDYVAGKVSPQKRLRGGVIFVKRILKNPSGKIVKKALRQELLNSRRLMESKL